MISSLIQVLDTKVVDQIAAGEVVERPASVIKELVENAIDAGARRIQVLIEKGGLDYISVIDDGVGMSEQDLNLAVERFATSKLRTSDDLERIITYGFRGEALPSIASVSKFCIKSRLRGSNRGSLLEYLADGTKKIYEISCDEGTSIEVKDLFYNVPARRKFLKSEKSESNSVKSVIADFAIAKPEVSFLLQEGNKELLSFNQLDLLPDRVSKLSLVQGKSVVVKGERDFQGSNGALCKIKVCGLISEPLFCPKISSKIRFIVNNRIIKSPFLLRAVRDGYQSLLKHGYYPSGLISIEISPSEIDVNVHPQKTEVRFSSEGLIFSSVKNAVGTALLSASREKIGEKISGQFYNMPSLAPEFGEVNKLYELRKYQNHSFNKDTLNNFSETKQQEIRFIGNSGYSSDYDSRIVEDVGTTTDNNNYPAQRSSYSAEFPLSNSNLQIVSSSAQEIKFSAQSLKFLGQVFKLYLFFGSHDKVAVVDMHAAHERVTFYRLKKEFLNKQIKMQDLLFPLSISIDTLASLEGIEEKLDALKILGIEAELRNNEIIVRALSPLLDSEGLQELVVELLDKSPDEGVEAEITTRLDSYLARLACHGSLRRGRDLKSEEAYELMVQLESAENSGWCPHGRPIIWWLSEKDLEKQFGRIQ